MTRESFIRTSLEHNLFYSRLLKDYCVIIAAGLNVHNLKHIQALERYKIHFEILIADCLELGSGLISASARDSGALVTEYTAECEARTQELTGLSLNRRITVMQRELFARPTSVPAGKLPAVYERTRTLNAKGAELADAFARTAESIVSAISTGKAFSFIYPQFHESGVMCAHRYFSALEQINLNALPVPTRTEICDTLRECAEYIRGMCDPRELTYITNANTFATEFAALDQDTATNNSLIETVVRFQDFLRQITDALLGGSLRSVMLPAISDMCLRQVNRYLNPLSD